MKRAIFRYTFNCNNIWGGADDYGSTHFDVIAKNQNEAWKKAEAFMERKDIISIFMVKHVGYEEI